MGPKKKVTWNAGQVPERTMRPRLPVYVPEPDISDSELKDSWSTVSTGQMCVALSGLAARHAPRDSLYPHMVLYPAGGWVGESSIAQGDVLIYVGQTYVNCMGSKNRIISRPYKTVFHSGVKYLISDPNYLKPITE